MSVGGRNSGRGRSGYVDERPDECGTIYHSLSPVDLFQTLNGLKGRSAGTRWFGVSCSCRFVVVIEWEKSGFDSRWESTRSGNRAGQANPTFPTTKRLRKEERVNPPSSFVMAAHTEKTHGAYRETTAHYTGSERGECDSHGRIVRMGW